ncbi:MAG: hypothetical protein OCU12_07180 [Methanophagales archaeon]|nr:hypothetical protein [Methanophagales archaeon]
MADHGASPTMTMAGSVGARRSSATSSVAVWSASSTARATGCRANGA